MDVYFGRVTACRAWADGSWRREALGLMVRS